METEMETARPPTPLGLSKAVSVAFLILVTVVLVTVVL